jgi:hypothetical protein
MKKRKVRLHALKCCLFGKYRHCPQHRRLPTPRYGAAIRHIGRLVPGKQRTSMNADLRVAPRQFGGSRCGSDKCVLHWPEYRRRGRTDCLGRIFRGRQRRAHGATQSGRGTNEQHAASP